MPDKEKLSNMLDNLIDNKPEQAQVDFHDYLQDKMAELTNTPVSQDTKPTDKE